MTKFNKYSIRPIIKFIETGNIDSAVDMTVKGLKTKPFYLSAKVGQVVAQYSIENYMHDLQMDRLADYLKNIDKLQLNYL